MLLFGVQHVFGMETGIMGGLWKFTALARAQVGYGVCGRERQVLRCLRLAAQRLDKKTGFVSIRG